MSYIISPIKDSMKVTYEVQKWMDDPGKWIYINSLDSLEEAMMVEERIIIVYDFKTRVIQRTESVALVLREVE